jgi:hypothetical protein
MKLLMLGCSILAGTNSVWAQASGSAETIGGVAGTSAYSSAAGDITSSVSETLYIGPGNYNINGTWEIYSKKVWISPDAVITGSGTIKFFNPSVAGGTSGPTYIDGNNNAAFINVNIELQNAANMVLADIAGPGGSWTDVAANANLTVGADFNFAVANGDVLLGNYDLVTAAAATLSGYRPDRFVVTNGSGHLVHNNYAGAFVYPVGIAEGDYTPASVSNTAANTIHVMVQNYAASAPLDINSNGIDRTWNIYADNAAVSALIDLQHNLVTNNYAYTDASAFVTQYGPVIPNTTGQTTTSTTAWQSNNMSAGSGTGTLTTGAAVTGASELSLSYASLATSAAAAESFFTKSSNPVAPLPVTLVRFDARPVNCSVAIVWTTAAETSLKQYELQRSADAETYQTIAQIIPKGNSSSYAYTDNDLGEGRRFYRLRITEAGNKAYFSTTVSADVNCAAAQEIQVFPNPAKEHVLISGIKAGYRVILLNAPGQKLQEITAAGSSLQADMSNYDAGIYLLQVTDNGALLKNIKIVKR